MRPHRGLNMIVVMIVLALAGAAFWLITFGEAYWDDIEVKHLVKQTANLCYREKDDGPVRRFFFNKIHELFDYKVEDHGRVVTVNKLDFDTEDLRIERSQVPLAVNVWFTYNRTIKIPLLGGERTLQFSSHVEQDLSPVKW